LTAGGPSGLCLAPLSPPDDSPEQQIAAAEAIWRTEACRVLVAEAVQTRFLAQERSRREAMMRMAARASAFRKGHENGCGISAGPLLD
jgi:hypothetical protein